MRAIAFTMLTPFFFIKAGTFISLSALLAGFALIVALLAVKIVLKFIGVWPLTRVFRMPSRAGHYTTLLMSTGLTFGVQQDRGLMQRSRNPVLGPRGGVR